MTNLKFRTYHKKEQKMYLVSMINFDTEEIIISQNNKPFCDTLQMNEVEIMQSTGLFDKNGKEIFEGDIVNTYDDNGDIENNGVPGLIIFKDCCFHIFDDYERLRDASAGHGSIMIIGNIYENGELLNS